MQDLSLGINTGFAVNRYPLASEWLKIIELSKLKKVQITADILDPRNPKNFIDSEIEYINAKRNSGGPIIGSAFTGAFTRLNLFGHPNKDVREYWFNWYKKFIDIAAKLGAKSIGGHLSIISLNDDSVNTTYNERLENIIQTWIKLSNYAKNAGIPTMIWEPMSIAREFGETIISAEIIQKIFDDKTNGAIKMCLDVDHGDITSNNKNDTDPYEWIKKFAYAIECIHLKQSSSNKGGHWPFIDEYNKDGKIKRKEMINAIKTHFNSNVDLYLEISFRERNPVDKMVQEYLSKSAEYWISF